VAAALKIVVLNRLADRHITAIKNAVPEAEIIISDEEHAAEHMPDTNILVTWGTYDTRPLYLQAPNLQWVHALSAGVEGLLFPEIRSSETLLTNSKGIHGIPVSEHVFAMILSFTRGLNVFLRQQDRKTWARKTPTEEVHEKTIAIVGLGSIGREIAKKAKGFGLNVVATKRAMTNEIFVDKLYPADQLLEMLAIADFVVVALPLLDETKEIFQLEQFKAMKKSAYFFNIARGSLIKEADLITALSEGIIKGAGLDVFEEEPLPADSPLWEMPNVIITPHIAAFSPLYLDRAIKLFADNLTKFIQNRELLNMVDKTKGY